MPKTTDQTPVARPACCAIEMLNTFLTLYAKNPANDDASFSLVNAFLELEGYDEVVKLSRRFQEKFTESEFFHSFI